jgi:hypothetical protein
MRSKLWRTDGLKVNILDNNKILLSIEHLSSREGKIRNSRIFFISWSPISSLSTTDSNIMKKVFFSFGESFFKNISRDDLWRIKERFVLGPPNN